MPELQGTSETFLPFSRAELDKSLTERFQDQVNKYPNRLAIGHSSGDLTYDQLNRAANVVARRVLALIPNGTRPIALLFHSDTAMIIALLGVLKAGRYCVPLDPSHPVGRNRLIVEEAQPEILITNHDGVEKINDLALTSTKILNIEELSSDSSDSDETPLDLPILPKSLAFVLFTSGTTGHPKGVVITHQFLMHLVMYHTNTRHICSEDRFSSLTRCHHIGGIADVFRALLNGAGLFPYDLRNQTMGELVTWLIEKRITTLHCVPTIFRMIIDVLPPDEPLPYLRLLHLGGEPMTKRDVELYKERFSDHCVLVNNFGSSETGPLGQYFVTKQTQVPDNIVPIHLKVEDKEIFLANTMAAPDGNGVIGEIAVRSRYLSPGYWEKSDQDPARRFTEQGDTTRTFFTGDLGQRDSGGVILYKGRKDHQVNIRGFRVDLIEIEANIRNLIVCKDVAVLTRTSDEDGLRLVAYVVPGQDSMSDTSLLRSQLSTLLPGYMIPEEVFFLESLPRTATGKVDRQTLSTEAQGRDRETIECIAPQNDLEEGLIKIWKDLLTVPSVGIRNRFMDLGGNSLIATRMANRIYDWLGIRLSIGDILGHQTVEELASHIVKTHS
ncbi:MAG: AMP-binding protein [Nitrospirales bacterium]